LITGLHGEGEFIGFVPLLENKPNNESAIVVKDAEIYLIPQQDFLTMISNNKEIAKKFISMLSSNLYEAENTMFELAYQSVRQRVATVLVKLDVPVSKTNSNSNGNSNGKNGNGERQVITVARKDLSKMVGTSTESLNRTLVDFKDEGLIELLDKGIKVIDHAKLDRIRK
jgi:CRP-like cAMP-binding protein